MRRLIALVALSLSATALMAVPAAADQPDEFVITASRDGEVDPCTGETVSVEFTWTRRAHEHNNNEVYRFDGVAVSSNGSVANGTEVQAINRKWLTDTFNWVSVNDTTGDRYLVKGRIKVNVQTGQVVKFDVDSFRCVGN